MVTAVMVKKSCDSQLEIDFATSRPNQASQRACEVDLTHYIAVRSPGRSVETNLRADEAVVQQW